MKSLKNKIMVLALSVVMVLSSVIVVSAEDIIEPDYVAIDCGEYSVVCGASCYYSSADAYTSVYPEREAYTSVYVGATFEVKDLSIGRLFDYAYDSCTDTDYADVYVGIPKEYRGNSTESVHNITVEFVHSPATTHTEDYDLCATY